MSKNEHGMTIGVCSSCQAAVVWAVTANGKPMPLNPKAVITFVPQDTNGNIASRRSYLSHWGTCPNAAQHRRRD